MQLKYARDIKWNDLERVENPFFAGSTVKRELSRPLSSLRGGFGSDSNPLALINKQGRQAVDADRLQQFYKDIAQGLILLVHDFDLSPQHRAFEPVVDSAEPDPDKKQYKLKDNLSSASASSLESVLINTKKSSSPGRLVSRAEQSAKDAIVLAAVSVAKPKALAPKVAACPVGCPGEVLFKKGGDKWGWDDYTDAVVPWMSVQTSKSDTVIAAAKKSSEGGKMCNVTYESSDVTIATVSPANGKSDKQTLTIKGIKKGEVTITAKCKGSEMGKFKVAIKNLLKKKVCVRLIHEKNYKSTDISDATIKAFLKKSYKNAVVEFDVTRLPPKTIDFDLDKSGTLKVTGAWPGPELKKIITTAADMSYDFNLFLVDNPDDNSLGWSGFNNADKSSVSHIKSKGRADATVIEKTVAHEAGHGMFGLKHPSDYAGNSAKLKSDSVNLMSQGGSATKHMLRKYQWDIINP